MNVSLYPDFLATLVNSGVTCKYTKRLRKTPSGGVPTTTEFINNNIAMHVYYEVGCDF